MENKKISVVISFSNSKTYPEHWKVRYSYKDGFKEIFVFDEISKATRFGVNPNKTAMEIYATSRANDLVSAFGCEAEVSFV